MKKPRLHACNILQRTAEGARLWRATAGARGTVTEKTFPAGTPLPAREVTKDWRQLAQKTVNIAWLPVEQVFLRVLHIPAADAAELRSMVELQLERLSPLPLAQVVWSCESLGTNAEGLQTVIVIIAARTTVETFLGALEKDGYLADRLEVPFLRELKATVPDADGVWLHPLLQPNGLTTCLAAWWYGGVLRDLSWINLPPGEAGAAALRAHLNQIAWAGELEGWLTTPPVWRVVAGAETIAATAHLWQGADEDILQVEPRADKELAELTAARALAGDDSGNLLPPEFAARYRQRFVDRLWMRGVGAAIVLYLVGVGLYLAWEQVVAYQYQRVAGEVRALGPAYTNALRLKARGDVLAEQLDLRFAALDSLRLAAEHLPEGLKLTSFSFSRGTNVSLFGQAPADGFDLLAGYNSRLSRATLQPEGPQFFNRVNPPQWQLRGDAAAWSFTCELNPAALR
jgi:hypothetical protein